MQDYTRRMQPVIDNLTPPGREIPTGPAATKPFGVFEDVLGSYSPGKHLTEVRKSGSIVLQWHEVLLAAIRQDADLKPTICARALYIVQVAVYDAWAAYSTAAKGVHWDTSKIVRQTGPANTSDARKAIAFAAYTAASALFPLAVEAFGIFMAQADIDPDAAGTVAKVKGNLSTPAGVGVAAGQGVITARMNDGSNQAGDYKDTTNYMPDNKPLQVDQKGPYPIANPDAWQPLQKDGKPPQGAATPHWGKVLPFSEKLPDIQIPPKFPKTTDPTTLYRIQADEVLGYSASLSSDKNRVISDYWADFMNSNLPPGHWSVFAVWLSYTRHYSIDQEVVLLFGVTAAMFDASIICWKTKYVYNSPRPITAVNAIYGEELVTAFKFGVPPNGESQVTRVKGCDWRPYQPKFSPSPPFPAYTSGHSTFGAAAATVLELFTGSNYFGLGVTIPEKSLVSDLTYNSVPAPAKDVTLFWETFSEASEENGISRLYGGVHYQRDNIYGMSTGTEAGINVWNKIKTLMASDFEQPPLPTKPGQEPLPAPKKGAASSAVQSLSTS